MNYNKIVGNVGIHLDTRRIDGNLKRAQDALDQRVLGDMMEYMPFQQGALRGATQIIEPGLIQTNTPYAHYQYMGELYLTEDGRSYAESGERKYPTGKPLHYTAPGTGDHWFETAKQTHGQQWVETAKRELGKG